MPPPIVSRIIAKLQLPLIFVGVCFVGAVLEYLTDTSCPVIIAYRISPTMTGIEEFVNNIAFAGFVLCVGIVILLTIRRFSRGLYHRIKLIYTALLPLLVFHHLFLRIPENIYYAPLQKTICAKASKEGNLKLQMLTIEEYDYLQKRAFALPILPKSADNINVFYFCDDFFGEYTAELRFECDFAEVIDTNKLWHIDKIDGETKRKIVSYYDFRD